MQTKSSLIILGIAVALAALWHHSQAHWDMEFETSKNPDGSFEWRILMPAARWAEIRKATGDDMQRQRRALLIVISKAFDAVQLEGRCRIRVVSLARSDQEKIEGTCQPIADVGMGTRL